MIAALLLAVLSQGAGQDPGGFELAEWRLTGPVERVRWDRGGPAGTEWRGRLVEGEELRLVAPVPPGWPGDPPAVSGAPEDQVRFLGARPRTEDLALLPLELRRRSRPPVGIEEPAPRPVPSLAVIAGALLVLAARRRPAVALALGALAALVAGWAQWREPPPRPGTIRVLEGDGDRWVLVEGAARELTFDPEQDLDLRVEPPRAHLSFVGRAEGRAQSWSALAAGQLWRRCALDPGARRVSLDLNLWGPLLEAWSRTADGTWAAHGAWSLGAPLGEGEAGAPPGWLASGLPQGRLVLVGRLDPEAWRGPPGPGAPGATWLRWIE